MTSSANITNFIEPTKDLMDFVVGKLEDDTDNSFDTIKKYTKTSYQGIFDEIKKANAFPMALVIYTGSRSQNRPRRNASISVMIIDRDRSNTNNATESVQDLLDKVIELVDHEILNQALFTFEGDQPYDFQGTNTSAIEARFRVEDH